MKKTIPAISEWKRIFAKQVNLPILNTIDIPTNTLFNGINDQEPIVTDY